MNTKMTETIASRTVAKWVSAPALVVTALLCAAPASAAVQADPTYTAMRLRIYKGGFDPATNIIFDDPFDNGNPLAGPNFSNGNSSAYTALNYQTPFGPTEQTSPNRGLLLEPSLGMDTANAVGGPAKSVGVRLQTNIDPNSTVGLKQGALFAVYASFLWQVPTTGFDQYGVRLTDTTANQTPDDVLDLRVIGSSVGPKIRFRDQDFAAHTLLDLETTSVLAPPDGTTFVVLGLTHEQVGSTTIRAGYGFRDAQGNLLGNWNWLNQTGTIFTGENFTRVELRAVAAVPEPETYALLLAGLGLLSFYARRRHA